MPDLAFSLKGHDIGYLRIVAEGWGLELTERDMQSAISQLVSALEDPELIAEVVDSLPEDSRTALFDLVQNNGQLPWSLFAKRYGDVREMGAGRRDRERPDRSPTSPVETLWYLALVGRAFFDTPSAPEEFAYIPENLLPLIATNRKKSTPVIGRPASPEERAHTILVSDQILDDACTLLAALRSNLPVEDHPILHADWLVPPVPLQHLLITAGLLDPDGVPQPESLRAFLEAPRADSLSLLTNAWLESTTFDELRLIPHLVMEGEWENHPRQTRKTLLAYLSGLPPETWWSLAAFIATIRQVDPDFQRPAGDYDSWFIRDQRTGVFLRGFENWFVVDGELIRFLITGPLHWLGIVDLATTGPGSEFTAFRLSPWAPSLLAGRPPAGLPEEEGTFVVRSNGTLYVPRLAGRAARYQIARFCDWLGETPAEYHYQLTPDSLERARQQGLHTNHLFSLLKRHAEAVPPILVQALQRWEKMGVEVRLEKALVLRVRQPEILQEIRRSPLGRHLGEPLGPTAAIVKPGAQERVLAGLAELGYLGEIVDLG